MRIPVAFALGLSACLAAACASSGSSPDDASAAPEGTNPAQSQQPAEERFLDEGWTNLSLQEQKQRFLVQGHIDAAQQALDDLRLTDAELELARALELDPDNVEARKMFNEVATLLGKAPLGFGSPAERLENLYLLKKEQAEADARQNLTKAKVLLQRGDYDAALAELTLCLDIVTLSPYAGDWDDVEDEARTLLATAREQRDRAQAEARDTAQRAARQELQRVEREESERRQNVLVRLLDQAVEAFQAERYEQAIELSDRVLRLDPRNEMALDIRDTSFRKSRELVRSEFLQKKREQYARWQEEQEELKVPYTDIMTLPDAEAWKEITERRAKRPGFDLSGSTTPGEQELRARLASERLPGLSLDEEESLTAVGQSIQAITSLPIVVDPLAEDAALSEGAVFDFDFTNPLTVEKALNLVAQIAGPEVTWTVRHDTVLFTTIEKARGDLIVFNHDVSDLVFPLTDFLAPRIDRIRLIDEIEDDDGGTAFGAIGEKVIGYEIDQIVEMITTNIDQESWDQDGINATPHLDKYIVVVHTAETQQRVRTFLEELRRFRSALVSLESKFMTIREGFLQEIGVDWRGLDGSQSGEYSDLDDLRLEGVFESPPTIGLDNAGNGVTLVPPSAGAFLDDGQDGSYAGRTENVFTSALGSNLSTIGGLAAQWTLLDDVELSMILTAVEKSSNAEIINNQLLSVSNTQRAYVTVVNQRAYVQDFEVEVAQFQAIADPVINVLQEGIVLEVRPTIDNSRKYMTLEIQPTVAEVVALADFATTLAGQTAPVIIQLPEVQTQSVFTTAVVPDGGSILLGGLSRLRDVERRAEVPFLGRIPLLGFFFKEEGYNDERESLMIMLRAWITESRDELAAFEE